MANYTWDHIHLRTTNPEAMAQWFEQKLGAEVIRTMQQGKPRIDMKLGGANIFIAPVETGDGVNARADDAVSRPRSFRAFGDAASMPSPPTSRPRASSSPASRPRCGLACASVSSARRKACRSNCSTATSEHFRSISQC